MLEVNEKNNINSFFEALSERLTNENDLSDITYALCKSDELFQKFFLKYCFEKDLDSDDLDREYGEGDSRPDFYFHDRQDNEYLIEIKIYDHNQHFSQYKKQFPNAKYAFIANYDLNIKELKKEDSSVLSEWNIRTWKAFYEKLEKSDLIQNELIKGYLNYLKNIINYREFKKMNIKETKSLPVFIENLKKVSHDIGFTEYNGPKSINENCYGQFFMDSAGKFYFWFGLYISEGEETIYIGLVDNETWIPKKVKTKLNKDLVNIKENDFSEAPKKVSYGNYGDYWFALQNEKYEILCDDAKTEEEQEEILKNFLDSVLTSLDYKN